MPDKEIDPAEYKEIKNEYEEEIGKLEMEIGQVGKWDSDLKESRPCKGYREGEKKESSENSEPS